MHRLIEYARRVYYAARSSTLVFWLEKVYGGISFAEGVRIYSRILVNGPGSICVGEGTCFSSRRAVNELLTTTAIARIRIGRNCFLNGAIIGAAASVTIGDNCIIAEAYIRDTASHGIAPDRRHDLSAVKIAPVVIENNVWIGSHVHVMPGVTIGENSIIGVNSVVTKSIPSDVFAAGNPARIIKTLSDMEKLSIERIVYFE